MIEVYVWTEGNNTLTQSLLICRNGRLFYPKELAYNEKRHIEISSVGEDAATDYYCTLKLKLVKKYE